METDNIHGKPLTVTVKLKALVDGKLLVRELKHRGQVEFTRGNNNRYFTYPYVITLLSFSRGFYNTLTGGSADVLRLIN